MSSASSAAADVVDVVGVAVVGRAERDDRRLQRRRAAGGDLQPVEAAPGDARSCRPSPVHHGWAASQAMTSQRVVLLLRQILVVEHPVGVAGAAHVDAHAGVAVAGEVGMVRRRRGGACRRACGRAGTRGSPAPGPARRPPAARSRGEPRAVRQRDPRVVDRRTARGKSVRTATGWRESKEARTGAARRTVAPIQRGQAGREMDPPHPSPGRRPDWIRSTHEHAPDVYEW